MAARTGSKCLSSSSVSKCQGSVIHDSHAEVLALRALNRFLLLEVYATLRDQGQSYTSPFVCYRRLDPNSEESSNEDLQQPYEIRPDVSIYMFSSEAPCGDASMEIIIAEKGTGSVPWEHVPDCATSLQGRGYFSALGCVRRKPSRGDAEATTSKSCTDKLALRQITSLLSFPASLIIAPTRGAYLSTLIVPAAKYSEIGFQRAFGPSGRLARLHSQHHSSVYNFQPFRVATTQAGSTTFAFSKPGSGRQGAKAGNVSAVFIKHMQGSDKDIHEAIVGGVKQGFRQFPADPRKLSSICRRRMWELVLLIIGKIQNDEIHFPAHVGTALAEVTRAETYAAFKACRMGARRRAAKQGVTRCLGGWTPNHNDEDWCL